MFGIGFIFTIAFVESVQPFAPVPITLYVVVAFGVAITIFPVDVFKLDAGDHK